MTILIIGIAVVGIALGAAGAVWAQDYWRQRKAQRELKPILDWRPTLRMDARATAEAELSEDDNVPANWTLQTEEIRLVESVGGYPHVESRWRPATRREVRDFISTYQVDQGRRDQERMNKLYASDVNVVGHLDALKATAVGVYFHRPTRIAEQEITLRQPPARNRARLVACVPPLIEITTVRQAQQRAAMEESMLGPKILPAIFLVLPPTILLMAQASAGTPAAAHCSTRPGSSAPEGTHWYYRVNRTDNRHCWYLSSAGMKVRSDSRAATSDVALPSSTPKRDNDSETARATPPQSAQIAPVEMAPAQATPADPAFLETRVDGHAAAMDFTRRWPDLSESRNLEASELSHISNSYTNADAEQRMPLIWPVTDAERVGQQQDPAGQAAFGSVFLVSALALGSLSLFGGVFKLVRRSRQGYLRDPWRAATGRSVRVPRPTDPAHDLKTSLAELMQDLQRAGAASRSPRAFTPPVRRARQGTADRTNVSLVRREGIVPAPEANQLCGDKNEGSRVQRRSPASEMRDVAGIDVETCAV